MVEIRKNLVDATRYAIKCPYAMVASRIVVHNTANDASAENEISYMKRNQNEVSFHYAIDDKEIVQGILESRNAWHAGDGGVGIGNRQGIAIEICYSKSGGERFIQAEKNAAEFIAYKLKEYGWGLDKVTRHQDYSGKYCPHRTLDMGWQRFLDMIKSYMDNVSTPVQGYVEEIDQILHLGSHVKCNFDAMCVVNYDQPTGDVFLYEIDTWVHPKDVDKNHITYGSDFILYLGDKVHFNVNQMTVTDYDEPTGDVFIKEIDTWVHPKDFTEIP